MKMIPMRIAPFTAKNSLAHSSSKHLSRALMTLGLSAILLSGLSGCSFLEPYKATLTQGTIIPQANIDLIQKGLTQEQARQLFGPPMGNNPFNPNHWAYVYYSTDTTLHSDAIKRLTLVFDEDKMIESWSISDEPVTIIR